MQRLHQRGVCADESREVTSFRHTRCVHVLTAKYRHVRQSAGVAWRTFLMLMVWWHACMCMWRIGTMFGHQTNLDSPRCNLISDVRAPTTRCPCTPLAPCPVWLT